MGKDYSSFTVFFEAPFWVGIFERVIDDKLFVSKTTFGSEPTDNEIKAFLENNFKSLIFSCCLDFSIKNEKINFKKRIKKAQKELKTHGVGTKAQDALQKQHEQMKIERKK